MEIKAKILKIMRASLLVTLAITFVLLFSGPASEELQSFQKDGVAVIQSDDYGIVLELITSFFNAEEKSVDGETYQVIKLPYTHSQTGEAGTPQVPIKSVLLGIPFNANIKVKVLDYDRVILSGYNLCPVQKIHLDKPNDNAIRPLAVDTPKLKAGLDEEKRRKELERRRKGELDRFKQQFIKDERIYSKNKFYPDILAETSLSGSLRGQNVAKLDFYPIQFNPATGKLRFYKRIRVEVDFGKGAEIDWKRDLETPVPFKKLYKDLFLNYKDIRWWKRAETKPGTEPSSQAESESETGLETGPSPELLSSSIDYPVCRYKISINEEGMYRLTWQDLSSAGLNLSTLDPRTIKIFNKGEQVRIYVNGEEDGRFDMDDYIEFYGKAVSTRYTSTNVYWLMAGGREGLRMIVKESDGENPLTPVSFKSSSHLERNDMYWMELPDKGYVDDHWFFYDILWDKASVDFTMPLTGVAGGEAEAKVEVSLQGLSYSVSDLGHHSLIYLNGNLIDDAAWGRNVEYRVAKNVPQAYLKEGDNVITVELPGDTGAPFELVLVNWFEISYWREFKAVENCLKFNHQGEGLYLYKISNFDPLKMVSVTEITREDIGIFDITDSNNVGRVVDFDIEEEDSFYRVIFEDRISGAEKREYLILTSDKFKKPINVVEDALSNLRLKENGADYIIITHEDFYDKVLPLADYHTFHGLRVKVVKIQDIYDEFSYGIFDPAAIKDFLTYTYSNWIEPAPTYVLLVGDGTYDYRDFGGFGCKNYVPTYMVHSLDFGETGTDNWFVCLDGEDDILPDMFIGRFPVKTAEGVAAIVNKTIDYNRKE